jgi:ribosomal protein S6
MMNFSADADVPQELERNYKITDSVIRFLTIRIDD